VAFGPSSPHDVSTGKLAAGVVDLNADDCDVYNEWISKQQAFEFCRCNLEAADFDEFLEQC